MAASARVQQILSDVRALPEEELTELEVELLADDAVNGKAWGEEIELLAARVLAGDTRGLGREQIRSLFAMSPPEARAQLNLLLDPQK